MSIKNNFFFARSLASARGGSSMNDAQVECESIYYKHKITDGENIE